MQSRLVNGLVLVLGLSRTRADKCVDDWRKIQTVPKAVVIEGYFSGEADGNIHVALGACYIQPPRNSTVESLPGPGRHCVVGKVASICCNIDFLYCDMPFYDCRGWDSDQVKDWTTNMTAAIAPLFVHGTWTPIDGVLTSPPYFSDPGQQATISGLTTEFVPDSCANDTVWMASTLKNATKRCQLLCAFGTICTCSDFAWHH